ncbi:hypothetical protein [Alsobacter soli]|uniref:hypothetical protein n=1 Tax=Alsobacter soli TaxID=2109933 RepID=UPI001304C590|nr:hypothetical protein [Alsobacter soli]
MTALSKRIISNICQNVGIALRLDTVILITFGRSPSAISAAIALVTANSMRLLRTPAG